MSSGEGEEQRAHGPSLDTLPPSALCAIAQRLDPVSAVALCGVCQRIRNALAGDADLWTLQAQRMCGGTASTCGALAQLCRTHSTEEADAVALPAPVAAPVHFPAFALFPPAHRDAELSDSDSGDEGTTPAEVGSNAARVAHMLRVAIPEIPETPCLSLSSPGRRMPRKQEENTAVVLPGMMQDETPSSTPDFDAEMDTDAKEAASTMENTEMTTSETSTEKTTTETTTTTSPSPQPMEGEPPDGKDDLESFEARFKAMGGAARSTRGIGFGVDATGKRYARRLSSPTPGSEGAEEAEGESDAGAGGRGHLHRRKKHASASASASVGTEKGPVAQPVVPVSQGRPPTPSSGRGAGRGVVRFAELLELPQFRGLKAGLQRFFQLFPRETRGDPEEEVRTVHCLIADLERTLLARSVWRALAPAELAAAREDMQRYVYARLLPVVFYKMAYRTPNKKILAHHRRLRKVVTPQYLDLDPAVARDPLLATATRILEKIDAFKTPAEKLRCITAACRVLMTLITRDGATAGADQFLPLFIYVVLHADLHLLQSDIEFISRFMDPALKYSEDYCFFTHLVSAYTFLAQQGECARDDSSAASGSNADHVKVRVHQPAWDTAFQRVWREAGKVPLRITLREMYEAERDTVEALERAPAALEDNLANSPDAAPDAALLRQLLSKYRCLWGVVQNHLPGPEDLPARVKAGCLELPAAAVVTALAVAGTRVFAGFSSGRVLCHDAATSTTTAPVPLFHCRVAKLLALPPAPQQQQKQQEQQQQEEGRTPTCLLWCLSERGEEALLDAASLQVLRGSAHTVHTAPFCETADAALAPEDNTVWSTAVATIGGLKMTQMALFDPVGGAALLRFPQRAWALCTAFCQHRLWALFDDDYLRAFDGTTGVPLQVVPLRAVSAAGLHGLALCAGARGRLLVLGRGDVHALAPRSSKKAAEGAEEEGGSPFERVAFYERGDSTGEQDPFAAMGFAQPALENVNGLLATVTQSGDVRLWDTGAGAPKPVLSLQGPHQPERLAFGEQEHHHTIAISKENSVYTWTFSHKNRT